MRINRYIYIDIDIDVGGNAVRF